MAHGKMQTNGNVSARVRSKTEEREMPSNPMALCRIEHEGEVYNYGDEVPDAVAQEFPNAVGRRPLTEEEIDQMSPDELRQLLKGQNTPEARSNA